MNNHLLTCIEKGNIINEGLHCVTNTRMDFRYFTSKEILSIMSFLTNDKWVCQSCINYPISYQLHTGKILKKVVKHYK